MIPALDPATLRDWLAGPGELALLDVREAGQFSAAHLFCAVPLPYSRLELGIGKLLPNPTVRVVLCDEGDGVAERAARRLQAMGYTSLHRLEGGPADWARSGLALFEGVNTVSKAFGELVEHEFGTPRLSAAELRARIERGDDLVIVDGRPLDEYRKMNIPGSLCCPNGELALRIASLAPDPNTTIVVNCAGRTRSIIGAQSLVELGVPNPVYALENGTQGWFLADYALEHGASRTYFENAPPSLTLEQLRARTAALMQRHGVPTVEAATVEAWRGEATRTTYLFDVRSPVEFAASAIEGSLHAPGGQLVQATDQWVGVRRARIVLLDQDGVRAGVVAMWLRAMGHDAVVLRRGDEARLRARGAAVAAAIPDLPAAPWASLGDARVVDLRESSAYRRAHAAGATWSIRPRVPEAARGAHAVALVADDPAIAGLAALDLREAGIERVLRVVDAPLDASTPGTPSDAEAIDFVFFAHGRHNGNRAAAEQYLRWETQLLQQLTDVERSLFALQTPSSTAAPPVAAGARPHSPTPA